MKKTYFIVTVFAVWTMVLGGCMTTGPIVDDLDHYKKGDTYESIRNNGEGLVDETEMKELEEYEEITPEDVEEEVNEVENMQENEENLSLGENIEDMIVCTADVKQCEDGSYVSRGGPNCEFGPCPEYQGDEQ